MAFEADHVEDPTSSRGTHSDLLSRLLHKTKTHDVKFLFGKSQLGAHRIILAERSPIFNAMFYGSMKEKNSFAGIRIQDCTIEAFTAMLRWIYTNDITVTPDIAQTLLYNAKKYLLDDLLPVLCQWLEKHLNNDTACVMWQQAVLLNEADFALQCEQFCLLNADAVLSDGVVKLRRDQLKTLLSHEDTNILDELSAYQAVIRWGRKQCAIAGANADDMKALRTQVEDLVQLVRLPLLSPEKLAVVVHGQDNVVPHKTMIKLLSRPAAMPDADGQDDQSSVSFGDWSFVCVNRKAPFSLQQFAPSLLAIFPDRKTAIALPGAAWVGVDVMARLPTTGCHVAQFKRIGTNADVMIGVNLCNAVPLRGQGHYQGTGLMFHLSNGYSYTNGSSDELLCAPPAQDDIVGCRLDMDKRTVEFTVNGESVGTPFTNIAPGLYKFVCDLRNGAFVTLI
eukprot:TRINITY_DN140_c0_g1_i9.p1 TRINITY_DN140_c0_g1~~TRINITY_DN140_c0_g1_i9.p1  ORF type:complete len:450 (-),score=85.04 TRINITY_DN140_c0_g1_i9:984-2333(-)